MAANKRAVHSFVQLFICFREFFHSVFRSFVFTGERFVDRLIGKVNGIPLEVLASKLQILEPLYQNKAYRDGYQTRPRILTNF